MIVRLMKGAVVFVVDSIAFVPLVIVAILSRYMKRQVDIGLGPEPLINNIYHKASLAQFGYVSETFCYRPYFITKDFDRIIERTHLFGILFSHLIYFSLSVFRYKSLYIYFTGGPLGRSRLLWRVEGFLLKLSRTKTVVMPYGSDVQDMTRSPNLVFKDAYSRDYKGTLLRREIVSEKVDYWCRNADHIIAGCEWVHYMYVWDTLMLGHFSIDTNKWKPAGPTKSTGPFKILHAPNHRAIKGTQYFIEAVKELRALGFDIELILLEGVSNDEIRTRMEEVDIVADQLIVGWYAMFALEGMSMAKPVLCHLRRDLMDLYVTTGIVRPGEIPIVDCSPGTVKETIMKLYNSRERLPEIGRRSRTFVERHHSLSAVGVVFDRINRGIGVVPSSPCMNGGSIGQQGGGV